MFWRKKINTDEMLKKSYKNRNTNRKYIIVNIYKDYFVLENKDNENDVVVKSLKELKKEYIEVL